VREIGFTPTHRLEPVSLGGAPLDALRQVLPGAPELVSGAGHDAMVLGAAGVPTAMLFVRSLNGGVSHSPDELSSAEDIELAIEALTAALARLAL
jgi:N-carbamoyl-L-amino-acid hydrolase